MTEHVDYNFLEVTGVIGAKTKLKHIKKQAEKFQNLKLPLYVYVNSEGGFLRDAFAIGEFIKNYQGETIAIVNKYAYSSACVLTTFCNSCTATPTADFLIHTVSFTPEGDYTLTPSTAAKLSQDMQNINNTLTALYSEKIKRTCPNADNVKNSIQQVKNFIEDEEDHNLTAAQMQLLGLVDDVVYSFNSSAKVENMKATKEMRQAFNQFANIEELEKNNPRLANEIVKLDQEEKESVKNEVEKIKNQLDQKFANLKNKTNNTNNEQHPEEKEVTKQAITPEEQAKEKATNQAAPTEEKEKEKEKEKATDKPQEKATNQENEEEEEKKKEEEEKKKRGQELKNLLIAERERVAEINTLFEPYMQNKKAQELRDLAVSDGLTIQEAKVQLFDYMNQANKPTIKNLNNINAHNKGRRLTVNDVFCAAILRYYEPLLEEHQDIRNQLNIITDDDQVINHNIENIQDGSKRRQAQKRVNDPLIKNLREVYARVSQDLESDQYANLPTPELKLQQYLINNKLVESSQGASFANLISQGTVQEVAELFTKVIFKDNESYALKNFDGLYKSVVTGNLNGYSFARPVNGLITAPKRPEGASHETFEVDYSTVEGKFDGYGLAVAITFETLERNIGTFNVLADSMYQLTLNFMNTVRVQFATALATVAKNNSKVKTIQVDVANIPKALEEVVALQPKVFVDKNGYRTTGRFSHLILPEYAASLFRPYLENDITPFATNATPNKFKNLFSLVVDDVLYQGAEVNKRVGLKDNTMYLLSAANNIYFFQATNGLFSQKNTVVRDEDRGIIKIISTAYFKFEVTEPSHIVKLEFKDN